MPLIYWTNREREHANAIVNLKLIRDTTEGEDKQQARSKIAYHVNEQSNCLGEMARLQNMV